MEKNTRGYLGAVCLCALFGAMMPALVSLSTHSSYLFSAWDALGWASVSGGLAFAVTFGVHWRRRLIDGRAERQWKAIETEVVRTEKVEQLGHTLGGLSEATDAKAGQLSEVDP